MTRNTADTIRLGNEIRALRKMRGLSRGDLAKSAQISVRQLGKIERGERGQVTELVRLAQRFGMQVVLQADPRCICSPAYPDEPACDVHGYFAGAPEREELR